jgi:flavodoxin
MCSISIGPEGAVSHRPAPAKMADKLRIMAVNAKRILLYVKTQRLVDQLLWRATQAAKRGDLSISLWLSDLGITKESAELVSDELKRDGFKCTVSNEITAQYSNTDWDSDDLLFISWE